MRSILVFAENDPGFAARLDAALALARWKGGHLSLLVVTPVARFMAVDSLGGSYQAAELIDEAIARDDTFAEELKARMLREDVPFDIHRGTAEPVEELAEMATLADLVVLTQGCHFAGQLALTARVPVLLVPAQGAVSVPFERVCVAWDGGDPAAQALRSSVSLLPRDGAVHLLTVGDEHGDMGCDDAAKYLSRHGIKAEIRALEETGSVEEVLSGEVRALGAHLLVMGAYGHSRLREFLMGGTTRHFLEAELSQPVLLAH